MLRRVCLFVCLAAFSAMPAQAAIITISDTEPMIDFPDCGCPDKQKLPEVLPFALFDFTGQPQLATITGIEVTLTMEDGDTAVGEFDHGNLSLMLDDVQTGIAFNDFPAGQEVERTFSLQEGDPGWLSATQLDDLILALQDNQLLASILEATPDDNYVNLYSVFDTTIRLTGEMLGGVGGDPVPEPTSIAVWGAALFALYSLRTKRKAKA